MKALIDKMGNIIINYNILDKLIYLTFTVLLLTAVMVFISSVGMKFTFQVCFVLYFILQYLELNR